MTMQEQQDEDTPQTQTTTRVCIKNVPLNYTEAKLKKFLHESSSSELLQITDVRILHTSSGKSRKLAFVGFRTHDMATRVVQRLNQTYAQTSKLTVELAFNKKHSKQQQPRPWSKHSVGSSRYQALHPEDHVKSDSKEEKDKDNSRASEENQKRTEKLEQQKLEFLAAMGVAPTAEKDTKSKPWSNDEAVAVGKDTTKSRNHGDRKVETESESSSDSDSDNDDSVDSGGMGADIMSKFEKQKQHNSNIAVLSDLDFMKSKMTSVENLEEQDEKLTTENDKDDDDSSSSVSSTSSSSIASTSSSSSESSIKDEKDGTEAKDETKTSQQEEQQNESLQNDTDSSMDPHRLFCRNLPFDCTEDDLKEAFSTFGTVTECHLAVDDLRRNKGFAFVTFSNKQEAARALQELDGSDFQGRLLHVLPAKQKPQQQHKDDNDKTNNAAVTYKQKMEWKRKQEASSSNVGANASFIRGDAIVDNLSERLGITKESILNLKDGLSSGDAAVRLALGETHIIQENRDYFAKHGVDMDGLVGMTTDQKQEGQKRSNTAILVKNLPYDKTTLEDLTRLFHSIVTSQQQQAPSRILLPPSRTIALVEYNHAVDARRAFQKLAYKRFKHVPLYLEWAPLLHDTTKTSRPSGDGLDKSSTETKTEVQSKASDFTPGAKDDPEEEVAADDSATSFTIFVKNLNFRTTEDQLRSVFEKHVSKIRAVKIPTKVAPIRKLGGLEQHAPKTLLSMGYGFVECDSSQSVRKAIKALQGSLVDGHALELKPSTKQLVAPPTTPIKTGQKANCKITVRNVPFQATRTEILKLFGAFGQLKKVRLPKKFDGTHRGYAFVEFTTNQEAQTAMKSLSRTHLYGRHLVLEWAEDKDEAVQEHGVKRPSISDAPPPNKKIRFN